MTIVRDMPLDDGNEGWVLLSQIEHARLSGELAEGWGNAIVREFVPRREIVDTLFHHDDGWADWERQPDVDAETGRPIAFTEMPDDVKYSIWRKSIDAARALGRLQGVVVAWHFIELPQGANRWQSDVGEVADEVEAFIDEYTALAGVWLAEWLTEDSANTEAVARRALEWLQMFDVISLWLCMAQRREPKKVELPDGSEIVLTPVGHAPRDIAVNAAGSARGACPTVERIRVEPWPFREGRIQLEIEGRGVPARRYADASDLAAGAGDSMTLAWELVPE